MADVLGLISTLSTYNVCSYSRLLLMNFYTDYFVMNDDETKVIISALMKNYGLEELPGL